MAVLLSAATGNWLTAATWALVDSTSYLNSETANNALTASYVTSSTFTPGAITVAGVAVKLATRAASPTGTISVALDQATTTVTGTEVILNVSDLPTAGTTAIEGGWILFKFASPVTLTAATAYGVKAKTSSTSQVNLYSSATTNWSRALRTTTAQAPTTGDDVIVAGEHTGAGTGNDLTVTMNETAATDYGSATTSNVTPAISICKRGTLTFSNTSAANPKLRLSGYLVVYNSGALNIGTVATPIPRDSTAILEFDCAADGDFGLVARNGSSVNLHGLSRTSGKNVCKCLLAANASASGGAPSTSTLTVDTDTGWLSGDQIAIASTSRTPADCETGTLNADAGSSSLVVLNMTAGAAGTAVPPTSNRGLLVAHSGASPTQAEIILLTRNVKVRSVSATAMSFVGLYAGSNVDVDWVEFYYLGENIIGKRGVEVEYNTTGSVNVSIQYASIHDCEDMGYYVQVSSSSTTLTTSIFAWNTLWNLATVTGPGCQVSSGVISTNWTIDQNIFIRTGNGNGWALADVGGTFSSNTIAGAALVGITLTESSGILNAFSDNTCHSNGSNGLTISGSGLGGTMTAPVVWRNASTGISVGAGTASMIFDAPVMFGNSITNIDLTNSSGLWVKSPVLNGDTTFATTFGVRFNSLGSVFDLIVDNGDLSSVSGVKTAHSTGDIQVASLGTPKVVLRNTKLGATVEVVTQENLASNGFIASQNHDQTAGNHKTVMRNGTIQTDATTYNTAAPSLLMTPLANANYSFNVTVVLGSPIGTIASAYSILPAVGQRVSVNPTFMGVSTTTISAINPATSSITFADSAIASGTNVTTPLFKLESAPQFQGLKVAVNNSTTVTVACYVRKSATYNGSQPRLVQKANPAIGQDSDVVLATYAGGTGSWAQMSGTTSTATDDGCWEIVVDCDGAAGAINVDDFIVS